MAEIATKFVPLNVVDGDGNPWRPKHFAPPRQAPLERPKTWCGGFNVHGFTQEHLAQAKTEHEAKSKAAADKGEKPLPPFDAQTYMRQTRAPKLNGKAFALEDAADQYVALQKQAGRLNVVKVQLVAKK